jgi:uncharacterized C2H2 Zn-finger protein
VEETLEEIVSSIGNELSYRCTESSFRSKEKLVIEIHAKNHAEDELQETLNFVCDKCERQFEEGENYETHIKSHDQVTKIQYFCDKCEFNSMDSLEIEIHVMRHAIKCNHCELNFIDEKEIKFHMEQEHGFQCDGCTKCFKSSDELTLSDLGGGGVPHPPLEDFLKFTYYA